MNYCGGLDFGTSGIRITVITNEGKIIYKNGINYTFEFQNPEGWISALKDILNVIPIKIKNNILKLSISGTSGTLLACSTKGVSLGDAIPYNKAVNIKEKLINRIAGQNKTLKNPYSSLNKALSLIDIYDGKDILLRHQSDWIAGWMLNNWEYGEEGNNIKLGWDLASSSWPKNYYSLSWQKSLPRIRKSGDILGTIYNPIAKKLNLNENLLIIAGTTDSNAAFLAAEMNKDHGLTVLGTTIVLKKYISKPINETGITNHRLNGEWVCGGSSNAGCGILSKFFSNMELEELSQQINPSKSSHLEYLPLNSNGERFPINDPFLEPIITPRPVSDALFLHGLLEGLANIEFNGWKKFEKLTGNFPKKIITIGGGSKNPQWRIIREKIIKVPIISCNKSSSYGSALVALRSKSSC